MLKRRLHTAFEVFIAGLFIAIITFPDYSLIISTGIDPPISWVFNYLFDNGLDIGRHILFPHGPLAFLTYPLVENIILASFVLAFLKIFMVFNLQQLIKRKTDYKWLIIFGTAYFISTIGGFQHLVFANIILSFCNYYNRQKYVYKFLGFVLSAFAFYIKANIGITSLTICFAFEMYYFWQTKNYKKALLDFATIGSMIVFLWILMYGSFAGMFEYFIGIFNLASDNSSAVSWYPYNNWALLYIFWITLLSIPFLNKNKASSFYFLLVSLSIFAMWKHGMSREDFYHVRGFMVFVISVLILFVVFNKKNIFRNLMLSLIAISCISINMQYSINYTKARYDLFGINNFVELSTNFYNKKAKAETETNANIAKNKLEVEIRDEIGKQTVDVYPWDYSIILANNFNWQPRPVIQSYASYTHWLDKQNALHFKDIQNAPKFIIWELMKNQHSINNLNSIDNRYLLNDEPQTILQIMKSYKNHYANQRFLVLKKRDKEIKETSTIIKEVKTKWNEWLVVPKSHKGELIRLKLNFNKTIQQSLKTFFYKDEQFYIYMEDVNGIIYKHLIVPKNAKDGLWINPYITNIGSATTIKKIMFKSSNNNIVSKQLNIKWEKIVFENDALIAFWKLNKSPVNTNAVFVSKNDFEKDTLIYWQTNKESLTKEDVYQGKYAQLVNNNTFSSTFSMPLDSLPKGSYTMKINCWCKTHNYKKTNDILLIISIDNNKGNLKWKGISIDEQLISNNDWHNVSNFIYFGNNEDATISGYIWNKSDNKIEIDDCKITIMQ